MTKLRKPKHPKTPKGIGVRTFRILFDEDFIISNEYDNSLEKCLNANPDGVSNVAACKFLMLEVKKHESLLEEAERIIRQHLEQ